MAKAIYHSSIEGAQHGPKGLDNFLAFAKESGAAGAQPSNYMLESAVEGSLFKSAQEVKDAFEGPLHTAILVQRWPHGEILAAARVPN